MEIKELANKVKETNGNNTFTNKDLLFYLVGQIDKIDSKLDKFIIRIEDKLDEKMDKKSFKTLLTIVASVLIAILGGICAVVYDLIKSIK